MAYSLQFRRDTTTNWVTRNPILAAGEMGVDLTTSQFKIGDGVTPWTSLAYFTATPTGSTTVNLTQNLTGADSDWVLGQIPAINYPEYQNDSEWIIAYVAAQLAGYTPSGGVTGGPDSDWVISKVVAGSVTQAELQTAIAAQVTSEVASQSVTYSDIDSASDSDRIDWKNADSDLRYRIINLEVNGSYDDSAIHTLLDSEYRARKDADSDIAYRVTALEASAGSSSGLDLAALSEADSDKGLRAVNGGGLGVTTLGFRAGNELSNTLGAGVLIGDRAGELLKTNTGNVIIGGGSGKSLPGTNGTNSVLIGGRVTPNATYLNDSVFIGMDAGTNVTGSSGNIAIGAQAGDTLTTGQYNTLIGRDAQPSSPTANYELVFNNVRNWSMPFMNFSTKNQIKGSYLQLDSDGSGTANLSWSRVSTAFDASGNSLTNLTVNNAVTQTSGVYDSDQFALTINVDTSSNTSKNVAFVRNPAGNFTVNLTNLSLTEGETYNFVVMIEQGPTAYQPTLSINGSTITPWTPDATLMTFVPNFLTMVTYTIIRSHNAGATTRQYRVIASSANYGV